MRYRSEVRDNIRSTLRNNVVQSSQCPQAVLVELVQKKGGKLRLRIDYRQWNSVTKRDSFLLLATKNLFDVPRCAEYFSTFGLVPQYWQVELEPRDL